jgi:hypothetical protein
LPEWARHCDRLRVTGVGTPGRSGGRAVIFVIAITGCALVFEDSIDRRSTGT